MWRTPETVPIKRLHEGITVAPNAPPEGGEERVHMRSNTRDNLK